MAYSMVRKIVNQSGSMDTNNKNLDVSDLLDEERFAAHKGTDAAQRGEFAPDDEMETFYRCHRDDGSEIGRAHV